jgi:propionyl-CoA carboxylase alpha chain
VSEHDPDAGPDVVSVLVANRGEIARRVFRTARAMGLRTVAVFVDADAHAPFVTDADEAVRLRGGYLDGAGIIEAARQTGAGAVHPGYGFLSENAGFARSVIDAGLVWVGPAPEVIEQMGDKLAAKQAAAGADVPTLPSADDPTAGDTVGFPLLVKAAAGGGGKGMRVVETPAGLEEAVAAAQREAAGAFGDERVFLERFVPRARHVEIQILGDDHGGLVHLGERECSIQRRHQKIIEEAPSPFLTPERRSAMGEAALRLGRAIGYQSAGTVEFLVDDETGEFWFLEVNTRLQVEHPVTEAVTGIDLVRAQLRIATGRPLDLTQDDVSVTGHAVEARLYAEDASAGFLPATGTLAAFAPADEPAVRWDSGVEAGSVVGVEFDPMLAKVIAHGPTRGEAAGRLARALERLHVGGVTTNRDFLVATLRHDRFRAGATTTDFIERHGDELTRPAAGAGFGPDRAAIAVAMWVQGANRVAAPVLDLVPSGWRNARLPRTTVALVVDGDAVEVAYGARRDGGFDLSVDAGDDRLVVVHQWSPTSVDVEIDGRRAALAVTRAGDRLYVQSETGTVTVDLLPRFTVPGADGLAGGLTAPMPGSVLDVRVGPGDSVEAGQVLVVLEAMKMEHHISAPADGVVVEVVAAVGAQVDNGAVLLVLESAELREGPNP